ncbi:uncharacterized protein PG986_013791, partial [Apiospora aurea]
MTEHHHQLEPEVVASADLEPCSPKPINLSSPAAVPALQDQVDTYYTMSQPPAADSLSTAAALVAHGAAANNIGHMQPYLAVSPIQLNGDEPHGAAAPMFGGEQEQNEQKDLQGGTADVDGDDYAKAFDSPAAELADDSQNDVPQGNTSTASAADVKGPSTTESSSDAISSKVASPTEQSRQPTDSSVQSTSKLPAADDQSRIGLPSQTDSKGLPAQAVEAASKSDPDTSGATQAGDPIDIQALVDNITARAAASDANQATSPPKPDDAQTAANSQHPQAQAPTQTSSLPPRPPVSQQPTSASLHAEEAKRFPHANAPTTFPVQPSPGMTYPYGTDASYPTPPTMNPTANPPMPMAQYSSAPGLPSNPHPSESQQQTYEIFLQEERKYVSEAKWDRFPEGSRLFIGNLSSERVSKREVFDIFSRYGRMAQISLKQAYGFVQYHDVAEGKTAMDNLQGAEVGGRKINLEPTRAQRKENSDGDRQRGNRGKGNNANERSRGDGRRRDDYRHRSPSPARASHSRQGSFGRNRNNWDSSSYSSRSRGRSRSPSSYNGGYRRRSPSPRYRGPPTTEADLDIPRRYAGDVPDVQLLLLQEVDRDFVTWVQRSFAERGLKVDVMFLNPRAQSIAKIPLQVFDRSAGRHNARFDQYQDLDPAIAAELVARAKSLPQVPLPAAYGGGPPQSAVPGQPMMPNAGVDVNSILGALGGNNAAPPAMPHHVPQSQPPNSWAQASAPYGSMPPQHPSHAGDNAQHVQNIMAQLSRYR